MNTFQIIMFGVTLVFAYQIYKHVQTLEDKDSSSSSDLPEPAEKKSSPLVDQADEAYSRGDIQAALLLLKEAVSTEPETPEVLNKLAFVTSKSGDHARAIELYERSLELDENDDLTHNAIASLYRVQGAYDRAQDHYLKALEIDDAYAQTYYNYANLLVDMKEFDQAESMYRHALELQNDFVQAKEALNDLERRRD